VIEYREINQCERESAQLKKVWDVVAMVQTIYAEWRKTKWNDIDVEMLQVPS